MELYIIRHGQSANNALEDETQRTYDPPLTALGQRQAEYLADYLFDGGNRDPAFNPEAEIARNGDQRGFGFDHLYCSAMHRALQTAAPVAHALDLAPEVWLDIHEQGGIYLDEPAGRVGYPGKGRREILSEFPAYILPATITDAGWWGIERGYESLHEGAGRAIKVAIELRRRALNQDKDARIALITHGTFIDLLIKALLGQLPNRQFYFSHYNTGITRIDFRGERLVLRCVNRTEHLPRELLS